jgi:acyl-CoA synthetase (AMP-forming)/AMP-acid ligase II
MVTGPRVRREPTLLEVDTASLERGLVEPGNGHGRGQVLVGVGEPGTEHEVAIVDENTRVRRGPSEVGEIWVSGPSVASGYWRAEAEDDGRFRATIEGERIVKRYLRTGDLGFLRDGELFVVGRIKDVLIIRGRNVHPQDLELIAESVDPRLRPNCSAAFSVDADEGEAGAAIVLEIDPGPQDDLGAVIRLVRREVAGELGVQLYWVALVPAGVVPKTTSGKVQRQLCRERLLGAELAPYAESRLRAVARPGSGD